MPDEMADFDDPTLRSADDAAVGLNSNGNFSFFYPRKRDAVAKWVRCFACIENFGKCLMKAYLTSFFFNRARNQKISEH